MVTPPPCLYPSESWQLDVFSFYLLSVQARSIDVYNKILLIRAEGIISQQSYGMITCIKLQPTEHESSRHSTNTVTIASNIYFCQTIILLGEKCKAERLKNASMKKLEVRCISTVPPHCFIVKETKANTYFPTLKKAKLKS